MNRAFKSLRSDPLVIVAALCFLAILVLMLLGHREAALLAPAMAFPATTVFNLQHATANGLIGVSPWNAVDTVQRFALGTIQDFLDVGSGGNGMVKLIYLKGVAATAAGDLVVFDPKAGTTTRAVAASRGPLAVAMAATVAGTWGWYAIQGVVPVSTTLAGTGAANAGLCTTATDGRATVRGTANQGIDGLICKDAQDAPGAGFTSVLLDFPTANGLT